MTTSSKLTWLRKVFSAVVLGELALITYTTSANTITPYLMTGTPGGTWTYDAALTSGRINGATTGFTIFDFQGYVAGTIFAPDGWTATAQLTGGNFTLPAASLSTPDDPTIFNLVFTRTGPPISTPPALASLGSFGADTTLTSSTFDDWASRDRIAPAGGFHPPVTGTVEVPAPALAVPDGGLTVALLGFALMGVEGLRRRLSK